MKVLMLSTDASILKDGSPARARMVKYGKLFEELHIVIYATSGQRVANSIGENTWVYSTNTKFRPMYFCQAYKICKSIIGNWKLEIGNCAVSSQDPFETGLVGYWLKKKFGISLQIQIHLDFLSPYFWRESFKNKLRTALGKFLLLRADGVRVVSRRIRDGLLKFIPRLTAEKIAILPIYTDVAKFATMTPAVDLRRKYAEHDFIMMTASRLSCEKNVGLAISAFKLLLDRELPYKAPLLLVVGDGPEGAHLKSLAAQCNLGDRVIFEGWSDDAISYGKTADLFLVTSNYEGYGRTIVEATAAGVPIVATDVGVASEIVPVAGGLVVPVDDTGVFVDAVFEMMKRKAEGRLKVDGAALAGFVTEEEYLSRYREALERLMQR